MKEKKRVKSNSSKNIVLFFFVVVFLLLRDISSAFPSSVIRSELRGLRW